MPMPLGAVILNVFSLSTAVGALGGLAALYVLLRQRGVLMLLLFVLALSLDYLLGIVLFAVAPVPSTVGFPDIVLFSGRTRALMALKYLCQIGCFVTGPLAVQALLGAPARPGVRAVLITAAATVYALSAGQLFLAGTSLALPSFLVVLPAFTVYALYTYCLALLVRHRARAQGRFARIVVRTATVALACIIPAMAFEDLYLLMAERPPRVLTDPLAFLFLTGGTVYFAVLFIFRRRWTSYEGEDLEGFAARYRLSDREREVALLLAQGLKYKEIADRLYISVDTVKTHVSRVYRKTSTSSRTELRYRVRLPGI